MGVIIYRDANYEGPSHELAFGVYDFNYLSNLAIGDNTVSSVRVPEHYKVELYDGHDFTGEKLVLTADTPWLGDFNFNDRTSSIKVLDGRTDVARGHMERIVGRYFGNG
ncbi:beta/gamma crystallin-related protein [Streptomyces sp. NPDC048606]|uniref:beta/gamma crystallin-related protein n=1 Tax=Streptomyces sp. NPDC048606 TaxID=3154726 RepID=UPI003434039B